MASRWASVVVVAFFGVEACGGSSSETPFPQSADEVLPAMAAVRSRPGGSSGPELLPPPSASPATGGRAPKPSKPQISVSATSTPAPPPPGTPISPY